MAVKRKPVRRETKGGIEGITTCLAFKERAEEAVMFYVSVVPSSRIVSMSRSEGGPIPKGKLIGAEFRLCGREFTAFDGGPAFSFSIGMSLMVTCRTQKEIDRLWSALTKGGGEPGPCGWLTDRFGVSWQIVPAGLGKMLSDSKHGNSGAAMAAMLTMGKLDLATLERAYRGR